MLNNVAALFAGGTPAETNSYESIATVTVGAGGSSSVTFSSIPSTYKHLQLRITYLPSNAYHNLNIRMNNDTGANYSDHILYGTGSAASATYTTGSSSLNNMVQVSASTGFAGVAVVDILEYANTNTYKTVRSLNGADSNGAGFVGITSGNWRSTSAVNRLDLFVGAGTNLAQYSSIALYGIKG